MVEVCFVLLILLALGGAYMGVCNLKSLINEWIVCVHFSEACSRPANEQNLGRGPRVSVANKGPPCT